MAAPQQVLLLSPPPPLPGQPQQSPPVAAAAAAPPVNIPRQMPPGLPLSQPPPPSSSMFVPPGGPRPRLLPPPPQAGLPLPVVGRFPPPGLIRNGPPPLGLQPLMRMPPGQQPPQPHNLPSPSSQTEVWFEHPMPDGRSYYSHPLTQKTTWERPANAQILPQPAAGPPAVGLPFPPPGAPQLVPTRVWADHTTPEGKTYYFNKVTRQSVWEKPKDFELVMPLPASFGGASSTPTSTTTANSDEGGAFKEPLLTAVVVGGGGEGEEEAPPGGSANSDGNDAGGDMPASEPTELCSTNAAVSAVIASLAPAPPLSLQPPPPPAIRRTGPRPVSSVPIPGTPWSVVHTSDNRTFFFDATSRVSLWHLPAELEGNTHVLKLLEDLSKHSEEGEVPEAKKPRLDEEDSDEEEEELESMMIAVPEGGGVAPAAEGTNEAAAATEAERKASLTRASMSLEERQRRFKDMLLERGVSAFSTWEKELPKFVFDPRCMLLSTRERKACFEAFVRSRAEDERREKKTKLKEKREVFRSLLEGAKLHPKSSFSDFASRYGRDERFKSIEKMREREQLFSDFTSELKRASAKGRAGEDSKTATKNRAEKIKSDFLAMLAESEAITERSQWRKMRTLFERDPRSRAVEGGASQREEWFNEHVKALTVDPDMERQERIQASLKEREREVMLSRSVQEKEWGRERDHLRKTEAVQHFKALLVDMVKQSGVTWHDTKRQLRRDHRWELAELLDIGDREQLFQDHVTGLAEKKRQQFRRLLEETTQISFTLPWKKARKLIKDDPRYKSFSEHDHKREAEYDKFLRDKMVSAKNEFRALLRESKHLSHKSHELIRESAKNMKDIIDVLKIDQRYLVLECVEEEREAVLRDYLYELHRKGPPPPPTATNPSDRLKRIP